MAGDSVTIKNVSNGAIHTVTPEMWTFLEDDPIYELYPKPEEPETAKSAKKASKSGKTTGKTASESKKATGKSAKTK